MAHRQQIVDNYLVSLFHNYDGVYVISHPNKQGLFKVGMSQGKYTDEYYNDGIKKNTRVAIARRLLTHRTSMYTVLVHLIIRMYTTEDKLNNAKRKQSYAMESYIHGELETKHKIKRIPFPINSITEDQQWKQPTDVVRRMSEWFQTQLTEKEFIDVVIKIVKDGANTEYKDLKLVPESIHRFSDKPTEAMSLAADATMIYENKELPKTPQIKPLPAPKAKKTPLPSIPPYSVIKLGSNSPKKLYIAIRINKIKNKRVGLVLGTEYVKEGKTVKYGLSDLRYDLHSKYITLD